MSGKLCESCGKLCDWTVSVAGKLMLVDRDSAGKPGGNLAVWKQGRKLYSRVLTADAPLQPGEKMGLAHWASCPNARSHRKARR